MQKQILIFDKAEAHSNLLLQNNTQLSVSCYQNSLAFQIDCINAINDKAIAVINPQLPTQPGMPSTSNLVHILRAANPKLKIYFVFESQKHIDFYQKNIRANVDGFITDSSLLVQNIDQNENDPGPLESTI